MPIFTGFVDIFYLSNCQRWDFSRKKHSGQCRVLFSFKSAVFFDVHAALNSEILLFLLRKMIFSLCCHFLSGKITALIVLDEQLFSNCRILQPDSEITSRCLQMSHEYCLMNTEGYLPAICFSCCSIIFFTIYPPTDPFCLEVRSPL